MYKPNLIVIFEAAVLFFCSVPVSATLINISENDLNNYNDSLITIDTFIGREWLDLTVTTGLDSIAMGNNCTPVCNSERFSGWTWATELDVINFMHNVGLSPYSSTDSLDSILGQDITAFMNLVGITLSNSAATKSLGRTRDYIESGLNVAVRAEWADGSHILVPEHADTGVQYPSDGAYSGYGFWLYRDITSVPESGTIFLLGIGIILIKLFGTINKA